MTLVNDTADYMRGFRLSLGRHPTPVLEPIQIDDALDRQSPSDGRIAPVSRLARAFLDGIERGQPTPAGFAEGLRVQALLDKARQAHDLGRWLDIGPDITEKHA